MKLEDICKCKYCGKEFKWAYHVPQIAQGIGILDVENQLAKDSAKLFNIKAMKKNGYEIPLEAIVYCLYCEEPNEITIEYNS
ncbi:hypothetical protein [Inconstantimicrobium mannanitabidum]|uniref:Uncharacterized protein n=1 Tax=Inconstantimicrobium mannanitabidum TaxID=1604901 RepID=A0ACB5RA24_9CLOT|nr:hypothetical protein [Clostridium sp. TW13]GKX65821.1 hypothetical protein rsdtw13_10790 [Clostridium sp. TW13]